MLLYSVGKGSDELASQRELGDVDKESQQTGYFPNTHVLFRGYLRVNHRTSVLSTLVRLRFCLGLVIIRLHCL